MRILICSNIYPPRFIGGAEIIAHQQAKALKALGNEVSIFAGDIREGVDRHTPYEEAYEGLPVTRVRLTSQDFDPSRANFTHETVEKHFINTLNRIKPDIVHCHNLIGLSAAIPAIAKSNGIPSVLTLHDHWGYCYKNTAEKSPGKICTDHTRCSECKQNVLVDTGGDIPIRVRNDHLRALLDSVDLLLCPSDYLRTAYMAAGFPPEKLRTCWNGVDTARFLASDSPVEPHVRFTFVGHFGKHKGVETLIRAASKLPERLSFILNLVGEGDQADAYRALAASLGIEGRLRFWGKIANSEIHKAYSDTDVLVLPSVWPENQPVSITEAMAAGIPVLASRLGGIPELVVDGQTGFTFEPGDLDALAEKMLLLADDPALRESLGQGGRRLIESHSTTQTATLLVEHYNSLKQSLPTPSPRNVIVCVGATFSPACLRAIDQIKLVFPTLDFLFCYSIWPLDEIRERVLATVLVGPQTEANILAKLLRLGAPLIVPGANQPLRSICEQLDCGLYYESANELTACLAYLYRRPQTRRVFSKNVRALRACV